MTIRGDFKLKREKIQVKNNKGKEIKTKEIKSKEIKTKEIKSKEIKTKEIKSKEIKFRERKSRGFKILKRRSCCKFFLFSARKSTLPPKRHRRQIFRVCALGDEVRYVRSCR